MESVKATRQDKARMGQAFSNTFIILIAMVKTLSFVG